MKVVLTLQVEPGQDDYLDDIVDALVSRDAEYALTGLCHQAGLGVQNVEIVDAKRSSDGGWLPSGGR